MASTISIGTFEIERTVPMNMYSLSKGRCCLITIIGFLLGLAVVIVGLLGPPITSTKFVSANASETISQGENHIYVQTIFSPPFSQFNRQMLFKALATVRDANDVAMILPLNITIKVEEVESENITSSIAKTFTTQRAAHCSAFGICDPFDLIRFVRLPSVPFVLHIAVETTTYLSELKFQAISFNPDFTSFELWLRVSLICFAFILVCWFVHMMRKWPIDEWNLEQAWMAVLLCGLIFYNDPIFGILLLSPSTTNSDWPVAEIVSFSLRTLYLALLLVFWLSILHGIRESTRTCRFYVSKFFLPLALWAVGIAVYSWTLLSYVQAPEIDPCAVKEKVLPLLITLLCVSIVYFLVLIYHFLRSCVEVCRLSYVNVRLLYAACLGFGLIAISFGLALSTVAVPEWRPMLGDPTLFFYSSPFLGLGFLVLVNAHAGLSAILYGPAVSKFTSPKDTKPLVMAAGGNDDSDDEEVVYEDLKSRHRIHQYAPVSTRADRPVKSYSFQN